MNQEIAEVLAGTRRWCVVTGDCLDILPTLPMASLDCVLVDPPFSINTKSDGMGKLSPWADMCNAAVWYRQWMHEARRVLKDTGCMWSCLNWRSMVTFQKAACDLGWPIESVLVWDKKWIGPGGTRGLRPSYEMVALWCMPGFSIDDRGLPDIQAFPWSSHKPNGHPAEKPPDLMGWIIDKCVPVGGVIGDFFAGSGTVGDAASRRQIRYVGAELDEEWAAYARRRIAEADTHLFNRESQ